MGIYCMHYLQFCLNIVLFDTFQYNQQKSNEPPFHPCREGDDLRAGRQLKSFCVVLFFPSSVQENMLLNSLF